MAFVWPNMGKNWACANRPAAQSPRETVVIRTGAATQLYVRRRAKCSKRSNVPPLPNARQTYMRGYQLTMQLDFIVSYEAFCGVEYGQMSPAELRSFVTPADDAVRYFLMAALVLTAGALVLKLQVTDRTTVILAVLTPLSGQTLPDELMDRAELFFIFHSLFLKLWVNSS